MDEIKNIAWLFPILFMIHDFEEIILIAQWKRKDFYPDLKIQPYRDFISTPSFSIAVAQEFLLFSLITWLSIIFGNYFLWFGLFSAIVIHFVVHGSITVIIKKYHPGWITSLIFTPLGIYLLLRAASFLDYSIWEILGSLALGTVLLLANLKLLHKSMPVFDKWIKGI